MPPVVAGGALIVPAGLLASLRGAVPDAISQYARDRSATERAAVDAVMDAERKLGRDPLEMPPNNKGYDIESKDAEGTIWFIEVKGRIAGAETFTITRSEVGVGKNKPDQHILALVEVDEVAEPAGPLRPASLRGGWRASVQHDQCQPAVEGLSGAGRGASVTEKKKLIEVALPLEAINREAAREKSIRAGHPSTLHLWWARRPLAACRAVMFASLVDDPSAHPERFPTEEAQQKESGSGCSGSSKELVLWENTHNRDVLEAAARDLRRRAANQPPIVRPLLRRRLDSPGGAATWTHADASDLNPVAVLINKALIEIPPKFADQPPVHPDEARAQTTGVWQRRPGSGRGRSRTTDVGCETRPSVISVSSIPKVDASHRARRRRRRP